MAKLLETRLPNAIGEVSPDVYNRLVRVLELNLGTFDPSATPQHNLTTLAKNKFNTGDIIGISMLRVYKSLMAPNGMIFIRGRPEGLAQQGLLAHYQ